MSSARTFSSVFLLLEVLRIFWPVVSAEEYNLRWAAPGAGFRAWFANIGYAQAFSEVGLFSDEGSRFDAISVSSGSSWFATQLFFSRPFYENVTKGSPDDLKQFVLSVLTDYEKSIPNPISGFCLDRIDVMKLPGFQQFLLVCEFFAHYNNSWGDYNYGLMDAVSKGWGDPTFADRLATPANRLSSLTSTDLYIQTALSPVIRRGNRTTYYGPNNSEDEIYALPISLSFAITESFSGWVTGFSTERNVGKVHTSPARFDLSFYEPIFGSYPSAPDDAIVTTKLGNSDPVEQMFDWQEPWNGQPTVSQVTGASTAVLVGLSGISPQMTTTFRSVLEFNIVNDPSLTQDERESLLQILEEETNIAFEKGVSDGLFMCSVWPEECGLNDSALMDAAFAEITSLAHSIGEYQKNLSSSDIDTIMIKVILTDNKGPSQEAVALLSLFNTTFNQGIAPGDSVWPPTSFFGALLTPIRSPQIFAEFLDDTMLRNQLTPLGSSSALTATVLTATTVGNPAFGILGGTRVEIFYLQTNSDLPTGLFGKTLTTVLKRQYAQLAADISGNAVLKERLRTFLQKDGPGSGTLAPTTSDHSTSASSTTDMEDPCDVGDGVLDGMKEACRICLSALKKSGYSRLDTTKYHRWFDEESELEYALAGHFKGVDSIAEFVGYFNFQGFFSSAETLDSFKNLLPVSFNETGDCEVLVATREKLCFSEFTMTTTNPAVEYTQGSRLKYKVVEDGNNILISRVVYWFPDGFTAALLSPLDLSKSVPVFCRNIMRTRCPTIWVANGFDEGNTCATMAEELPFFEGPNNAIDGNSIGCRIVHASSVLSNPAVHCAHISFIPMEDPHGEIKCQQTRGLTVTDFFGQAEIEFFEMANSAALESHPSCIEDEQMKPDVFPGVNHPWIPPGPQDLRSPCPALNVLANHGFINRHGRNISIDSVQEGIELVFGVDAFAVGSILQGFVDRGLPAGTLQLSDLYAFEQDASLSRPDRFFEPYPQFNQDLFDGLMEQSPGMILTKEDIMTYQSRRLLHSRRNNPVFSSPANIEDGRGMATNNFFIALFGDDPLLQTAPKDFVREIFESERLPQGFLPRVDRGLPRVNLKNDLSFSLIEEFKANIDAALGEELGPTISPSPAPSASPVSTVVLPSCINGLRDSNFDIFDFSSYDLWFNDSSIMDLAETGSYTGAEGIAEYVKFVNAPYFESYINLPGFQYLPLSLKRDDCVLLAAGANRAQVNRSYGDPICVQTTVALKMHFTVSPTFRMHRIVLFYPGAFLDVLFGDILHSPGVEDYVCDIMESECPEMFQSNNLTRESCRSKYDSLPRTGGDGYIDGKTQGCRILHAPFASVNEKHCPHLSFLPQEDVDGKVKCQLSEGTRPEDLFSAIDLAFIRKVGTDNLYPVDTLYKECPLDHIDDDDAMSNVTFLEPTSSVYGTGLTSLSFRPFDPVIPCANGSPAGIYVEDDPKVSISRSRNHVLVVVGTGGCTTQMDCAEEYNSEPFKFSTTLNPDGIEGHTILSRDPEINAMHAYTKWVVPYCSQDFFLGDGKKGKIGSFTHVGSDIFDEALSYWKNEVLAAADMNETSKMSVLDSFVVVGQSAGALGVMNKVEKIRDTVESVGGVKNLRLLLDSPSVRSDRPSRKGKDFRAAMSAYVDLEENPLCDPLHPFSLIYAVESSLPCCLSPHCMIRHDARLSSFLFPPPESANTSEEILILDSAYDAYSLVAETISEDEDDTNKDGPDNESRGVFSSLLLLIEQGGRMKTLAMETAAFAKAIAMSTGTTTSSDEARIRWIQTPCVTHAFLVPSVEFLHRNCLFGDYDRYNSFNVLCSDDGSAVEYDVDFLKQSAQLWTKTDTWDVAGFEGQSIRLIVNEFVTGGLDHDSSPPFVVEEVIDYRRVQCSGPNCRQGWVEENVVPFCQPLIDLGDPFVAIPLPFQVIWTVLIASWVILSFFLRIDRGVENDRRLQDLDMSSSRIKTGLNNDGFINVRGINVVAKNGSVLLDDVDLKVKQGTVNAICGRSGSGKSTLLRALSQLEQRNVEVFIKGGSTELSNMRKVFLRQEDVLLSFGKLLPSEYLRLTAKIYGTSDEQLADVHDFTEQLFSQKNHSARASNNSDSAFNPFTDAKIENLSGGQRRCLSIACVLLLDPELLLLDEPLSGLDSVSCLQVMDALKVVTQTHFCTVLAVVHQPSNAILEHFDRLVILKSGKISRNVSVREEGAQHASFLLNEILCESLPEIRKSSHRRGSLALCASSRATSVTKLAQTSLRFSSMGSVRNIDVGDAHGHSTEQDLDSAQQISPSPVLARAKIQEPDVASLSPVSQDISNQFPRPSFDILEEESDMSTSEPEDGQGETTEDNQRRTFLPPWLKQVQPIAMRAHKQFAWGWQDVIVALCVFAIVSLVINFEDFFPAQITLGTLVMVGVPVLIFPHRILQYSQLWLAHRLETDDEKISIAAFQIASSTFTFPVPCIALFLSVIVIYGILGWSFQTFVVQALFAEVHLIIPLQLGRVLGVIFRGNISKVVKVYSIVLFLSFIFGSILVSSWKLPIPLRYLVLLSINFWALSGAVMNHFDDENYSNDDCLNFFTCLLSDGRFIVRYLGFAPLSTSFRALGVLTALFIIFVIAEYLLLRYQCAAVSLASSRIVKTNTSRGRMADSDASQESLKHSSHSFHTTNDGEP